MSNYSPVLASITLGLLLNASVAIADSTLVAVASNFTKPMTEIAESFEKATGHSAKLSFGSTGKFVSQIENGGPFEVLLAADETGPALLEKEGYVVSGTLSTYALGKLALWSATPGYVDTKGNILKSGNFKHVAIADPKVAPYGAAAVDYLTKQGLLDNIQPLLVLGENITQAQQFISTGNAELGFVALSQVIENGKIGSGSGYIIPTSEYATIRQGVALLTNGAENPAAVALLAYLKSAPALVIIQKYGYDLP